MYQKQLLTSLLLVIFDSSIEIGIGQYFSEYPYRSSIRILMNCEFFQQTGFGDCCTISRSLIYQLQWMGNLILVRHGFSNWNECKVSYWEFINWVITINGYLQFVLLDGYHSCDIFHVLCGIPRLTKVVRLICTI